MVSNTTNEAGGPKLRSMVANDHQISPMERWFRKITATIHRRFQVWSPNLGQTFGKLRQAPRKLLLAGNG